jgi:hypothetical protein
MCAVDSVDKVVVTCLIVNIHANLFARLVFVLTPLIDASLSIRLALRLQLSISGACHQHINVAFNLLRSGPVNLAVLLSTLNSVHFRIEFIAASLAARHLIHIARSPQRLSVGTGS